jgi:hypothetical protein
MGSSMRTLKRKVNKYINNGNPKQDFRGKANKHFTIDQERNIVNIIIDNYIIKGKTFDNDYLKIIATIEWKKIQMMIVLKSVIDSSVVI